MRLFQYAAEFVYNIKRMLMAFGYDVVVVQKGLISTSIRGFDVLLRWINPRIVFDSHLTYR